VAPSIATAPPNTKTNSNINMTGSTIDIRSVSASRRVSRMLRPIGVAVSAR